MNKQQLASKIWESANKMRSKIEANEYKDYILGFIFYKFLSEKELDYCRKIGFDQSSIKEYLTEEQADVVKDIQQNIGYFISYDNLFSTWLEMGSDFNAANVTDALSAFTRLINPTHKNVFKDIFKTLETGLSKLGETSGARTKAISDLIHLIKGIPMDGRQDYDVLGFIYEYLISNFAANAGKKAGEFYTPHEVSLLMSEIVANHLKDRSEIKIYDPTSGSGSLLINIGKCVSKHMGDSNKIKYYAQELKENTYNLTRMNLVMRGILTDNIVTRNGDTLEEDWPYFEENDPIGTYDPLYVDAVVSNPPYSQNWNPSDKEADPRYKSYGLAPKSKADYAFLLHDLFHIKPDGIMTIVLPHGVLFRGGEEGEIRKNLIENNKIDAIIGLPANIFFGTGIPTIIMVLNQHRSNTDILIIDASKGFAKVGKNNKLRACDIKKIVDAVIERKSIDKFSKVVSRDEIRSNDYNLNIPRYVDSSEKAESWDIYASMFGGIPNGEIDELHSYWASLPGLRKLLFKETNDSYSSIATDEIKKFVFDNADISEFIQTFSRAFNDFDKFLNAELIGKMESINVSKEESILSEEIFARLSGVSLVDRYEAYQILDNEWNKISVDIEMIQTEGFEATTQVDPNMVIKKKDGKETEVQDGFVGHILPFDLVQNKLLPEKVAELKELGDRISEITAAYDELLEELNEEEKEKNFVNEDKTAFVPAEVKKVLKSKDADEETLEILKRYNKLNTEEKDKKKELKEKTNALHLLTKETIENLTKEQVLDLLYDKWIVPILFGIGKLPENVISVLVSKLEKMTAKYSTTFFDVEQQIKETETQLIGLLNELGGNQYDMAGLEELKTLLGGE